MFLSIKCNLFKGVEPNNLPILKLSGYTLKNRSKTNKSRTPGNNGKIWD